MENQASDPHGVNGAFLRGRGSLSRQLAAEMPQHELVLFAGILQGRGEIQIHWCLYADLRDVL